MLTPPHDPSHFPEELRIGRPTLCSWPANGQEFCALGLVMLGFSPCRISYPISGGQQPKVQLTMGKGENVVWQDCQSSMHVVSKKSVANTQAQLD